MNWWAEHARCPWQSTVGQLAVGMLRTHAPPKTLCTHRDQDAKELERDASYGGRASVWYTGSVGGWVAGSVVGRAADRPSPERQIPGPVHLVDARSMYPTLLRDREFPVRLHAVTSRCRPGDPQELAQMFGVLARVTIRTGTPEYPCRRGGRVIYPVGTFTTTLTGPELLALRADGEVIRCHSMALYLMARPFAGAAAAMLTCRSEADARGAVGAARYAKLMANSLGGKLAQKAGAWTRDEDRDEGSRWGEECSVNAQTDATVWRRWIAGACWRYDPLKATAGPYAAAFAYLTAYGRLRMRSIRARMPWRSVVSQDTDGIWVTDAGRAALAWELVGDGREPGSLRVDKSALSGRWWGPRHYHVDGTWVLSGLNQHDVIDGGREVWDTVESSVWGSAPSGPPTSTFFTRRRSRLRLVVEGGTVGPDGWVRPLTVDGPERDQERD